MTIPSEFKFNNTITNNNVAIDDAMTSALTATVDPALLAAFTALVNSIIPSVNVPQWTCGVLKYSSATALTYLPYNGDKLVINGDVYDIPTTGIVGLANTNVYVNGVAGQNLGVSTLYYVYAFDNSGTVTADFSTTTHATSLTTGNVGTEIKSGDDTRSLIGMIRTNGSSQFVYSSTQLFVTSWFNKRLVGGINNYTANRSTTSTSYTEINSEIRIEFLIWANESIMLATGGRTVNSGAANVTVTSFAFDSTSTPENCYTQAQGFTASADITLGLPFVRYGLSEGYHYATILGKVDANTGTWFGGGTDGARISLSCMLRN